MKKTVILLLVMIAAAAASGCGRQCKKAREQILEPTTEVMNFLQSNPSGETLGSTGCGMILSEMQTIPAGAQNIRRLAERRFSHSTSHCVRYETTTRYECHGYNRGGLYPRYNFVFDNRARPQPRPYPQPHPHPRPYPRPPIYHPAPVCYPTSYTYCAERRYDTHREPGYAEAMELSQDLEVMYDRAQRMCGQAHSGDTAGAYAASRDLLHLMTTEVRPEGDRVYAMACGQ